MEISNVLGYAIVIYSILGLFFFIHYLPCLLLSFFSYLNLKVQYLTSRLICWHRFLSPWVHTNIIVHLIYITTNLFCLSYQASSITEAGTRAASLSLINLFPLFAGLHLSFLADLLGVSLKTFQQVHCSSGLVSASLVTFHTIVVFTSKTAFDLNNSQNLSAIIAGVAIGFIILLSYRPLRKHFYEVFLRLHQLLAALIAASIFLHIPSTLFPRVYFYTAAGTFISTFIFEGLCLLVFNGILKSGNVPIIGEIFRFPSEGNSTEENGPVHMKIVLQAPLKIRPGQYINIWIPSLGIRSWFQTHPFMVASWTGTEQTTLELLIEPRRGWTKRLRSHASIMSGQNNGFGRVLFSGPHGVPVPIEKSEYIFMVASGYGIIPHLPLLERLVQGTLAHEVVARRIHLIWEIEDEPLYKAVRPLFNWVLHQHQKPSSALVISLYSKTISFKIEGEQRAKVYPKHMNLSYIFETEIAEMNQQKEREAMAISEKKEERAKVIEEERKRIITDDACFDLNRNTKIFNNLGKHWITNQSTTQSLRQAASDTLEKSEEINESSLPIYTRTPRMLITVSASQKIRSELGWVVQASINSRTTLLQLEYQPSS